MGPTHQPVDVGVAGRRRAIQEPHRNEPAAAGIWLAACVEPLLSTAFGGAPLTINQAQPTLLLLVLAVKTSDLAAGNGPDHPLADEVSDSANSTLRVMSRRAGRTERDGAWIGRGQPLGAWPVSMRESGSDFPGQTAFHAAWPEEAVTEAVRRS